MTQKTKTILIIAGAAALVVLAVLIVSRGSSSDTRRTTVPIVQIEEPKEETVVEKLKFNGDVLPIQQANIYSKVSGNLERLYVDIGMAVANNALLALIDTTELFQQYQQASATYENARLNEERNRELLAQNLIARQDFDNAEAALKIAKAGWDNAQTKLDYAHIRAPFAGVITKRFLDQGANITANSSSLFTLMDMNAMKLTIDVPEKNIPLIAKGKKALVTVDAYPGRVFEGRVSRLSQAVDLSTRTMEAQVDIPNPERLLKPGMFAHVALIITEQPKSITIPTTAVLLDDRGSYVYVTDNGAAHRTPVTTGIEHEGRIQVLKGLSLSARVITVGQQFVRDGGPVNVQQ